MAAFKDKKNGTWYVQFRYVDWKGERQQKLKRGFKTKHEALDWEREFLMQKKSDPNMTFESFVKLYENDVRPRLKLNTWLSKESVIQQKILPYFAKKKLSEITAKNIIDWQNEIRLLTDTKGEPYSPTYLKTIHNQLSCLFNHAVKYYGLTSNPAAKAGNMGKEERREIIFWTSEEYKKFSEAIMDKPLSFYAFEMLYWCGIREGELLALTPDDFDFNAKTVTINKSYQRIHKEDVITSPKTKKSNRTIVMPDILCEEMQEYIGLFYKLEKSDRLFPITKHYLKHEMERGSRIAGVKRIKIHNLRHSAISLLIEMGFSAVAIAERVGHESIDITYRYAHMFPSTQTEKWQASSTVFRRSVTKMSAKSLDRKGRFRGKIVSFRCSEEENTALDTAVQLSGLTKQDYIISRVLEREITVQPNPRVYKALKDRLAMVLAELKRNESAATSSDLLETINLIAVTLNGIKGGEE